MIDGNDLKLMSLSLHIWIVCFARMRNSSGVMDSYKSDRPMKQYAAQQYHHTLHEALTEEYPYQVAIHDREINRIRVYNIMVSAGKRYESDEPIARQHEGCASPGLNFS